MDNLQLVKIRRTPVNLANKFAKHVVFVKSSVYMLLENNLTVYDRGPGKVLAETGGDIGGDIIQLDYLVHENFIWVGFQKLFQYINLNVHPIAVHKVYCQTPNLKIVLAEWNSKQDAFVAITVTGDLYIFEVDYHGRLAKEIGSGSIHVEFTQPPVTLGWGSSETQFQSPEEIAELKALKGEVPEIDVDCTTKVSWSKNGEQFAINYYVEGIRKIRIFNTRCLLEYESEDNPGLQSVIAWRPTGSCIASVIWTSKRCQIAFFENNALLKATYYLARSAYVEKIAWSPCGEVLGVHQRAVSGLPATIDLYWITNDQMHLKQRLQFLKVNPVVRFEFVDSPSTLINLRTTTLYESINYTFRFIFDCSQAVTTTHSTCATINGSSVYLTTCFSGMKPPPESNAVAHLDKPANFVIFHPTKSLVAFVDSSEQLTIFRIRGKQVIQLGKYQLKGEKGFLGPLKFYQFIWLKDKLFCVGEQVSPHANEVDAYYLVGLLIQADQETTFSIGTIFDKGINYMGYMEFQEQLAKKTALGITEGNVPRTTYSVTHLYMRTILIEKDIYVFSLKFNNEFFVNNEKVMQEVNSFILYDGYVFVTLLNGTLLTIRITADSIAVVLQEKFANTYSRMVEPGAKLICAIPNTSLVALQIPRGNVEFCSCRIVAIDRIEKSLLEHNWNQALSILRMEKLNWNILVDLNYLRFFEDIHLFITAMDMPLNISEFLLALVDHNVFTIEYNNCLIGQLPQQINKREMICSGLVETLIAISKKDFIHPIITACFVKDSLSSMNDAFKCVLDLLNQVDDDPSFLNAAMEAFKSAHTLKPSKEIFEAALLHYDINLIMFVGRNLEMDPVEYEPLVNELRDLPPCRLRFKINDYLKKYFEAFQYLLRCKPQDEKEVFEYVHAHNIYKESIWSVQTESPLFLNLCNGFARQLLSEDKHEEAAIYFLRGKLFDRALEAYTTALCWRDVIEIMDKLQLHPSERFIHLNKIAKGLEKQGSIDEAALLYEIQLNDYEMALRMLIENKKFSQAFTLTKKYKRPDIFDSEIVPGIEAYTVSLCDIFKQMEQDYTRQKTRLLALRTVKQLKFEAEDNFEFKIDEADVGVADDIGSIVTTSTVRTTGSTRSGMSARSRRKQQRKLHSTKEGSEFEDIALMENLHKLITSAFDYGPIVRDLCLIKLKCVESGPPSASSILMHNSLATLQVKMKAEIEEIWPANLNNLDAQPLEIYLYKNINKLDPVFRFPPKDLIISWKVAGFPTVDPK